MSNPVDSLQRVGVKVFADLPPEFERADLIPVFHRWIQHSEVEGLLIDVADYHHVHAGPSVILVAHEAHYVFDEAAGRPGLIYQRKTPQEGDLISRVESCCRNLFHAASLLESAADLEAGPVFRGDALQIIANDRLHAPNDEETIAALTERLTPLFTRLFEGAPVQIAPAEDPRDRLILTVQTEATTPLATLAARL